MGFVVHVAGNRVSYREPLPPKAPMTPERMTEWAERYRKVSAMVDEAERVPIDLPYAGETHRFGDPEDAAEFLEKLQGLGYRIPGFAIDALREEAEVG